MSLPVLHQRLGVGLIVVAGIGAVWALLTRGGRGMAALRAYIRCAVIALVAQAGLGLILVATRWRPREPLHWVYGAAALAALPVADRLARSASPRQERAILAAGAVATLLLSLRAAMTG